MTDTDNLSRRRFLQGTGAAATAAALAGCTGGDGDDEEETTEAGTTQDGGGETTEETTMEYDTSKTIRSVSSTMDTLDPIKATDTASGAKIQNIFDPLTNYPNGQTNVENLVADSLDMSEDQTTLTFTLKEGVMYNNDTELVADDVVYSFERLAASPESRRQGFLLTDLGVVHETETQTDDEGEEFEAYVPGTIEVEAVDDYTVEINLQTAFYAATSMLAYSAFAVVPEGIVGDIEDYEGEMEYQEFATANPVGAGPYTLDTWSQGSEVVLSARDEYHDGEPQNAGIHYQIFEEPNPMYVYSVENTNADGPVIPDAQYDPGLVEIEGTDDRGRQYGTYGPLENDVTADYYEVSTLNNRYLMFSCPSVPKPVRQAVAYAVNQQTVTEQLISTPAQEGYFFCPPSLHPGGPEMYTERQQDYKYGYQTSDMESAIQTLEDAGYTQDDPFEMSFDMGNSYAQNAGGEALFSLLNDQFSNAGLNISLNTTDWSTFLNTARSGNFDMLYLGWIADYPGLDNFLKLLHPPDTDTSASDNTGYSDWTTENGDYAQQAMDGWEMIQNNYGLSEEDAEGRAEGGWMMEEAAMEDAVTIPFMHSIAQGFSYPWLDSERSGAMGGSRGKSHTTRIGDRGEFE